MANQWTDRSAQRIEAAVLAVERQSHDRTSGPRRPPQVATGHDPSVVAVKNDSGYDRDRFSVLGLSGILYLPIADLTRFKNEVVFSGVIPDINNHLGRFAILLEPLKPGAIGRAVVDGICQVSIEVTDESHEWADIRDNDASRLASGQSGAARILWKEAGTGPVWAVVRVGETTLLRRFELKTDLLPGTYAEAYLLDRNGDADNYSDTFTVHDPLGWYSGVGKTETTPGSWGYAHWMADAARWEILVMEPGSGVELYEITGTPTYNDAVKEWEAPGKPVYFNTDTQRYTLNDAVSSVTLWMPTTFRGAAGEGLYPPSHTTGERVYTALRAGRREIIHSADKVRRFELKTALVPGGSATAWLCNDNWDAGALEFTVYDELKKYRGRANGELSYPDYRGAMGYARWMADAGRWAIFEMQEHALKARATCVNNVAETDATFAITDVNVKQPTGGLFWQNMENVLAVSTFKWVIDAGSLIDIEWNEDIDVWECVQAMCPGQSQ